MGYKFLDSALLGTSVKRENSYKIIGGGISGLFAGYFLKKNNVGFQIIEHAARVGGLIESGDTAFGVAEKAANGFIWCEEIEEIAERTGLKILPPSKAASKKYIVKNGKLQRVPLSFTNILTAVWKLSKPHNAKPKTVKDFSDTYLGNAVSENILNPAFGGIYGADIADLSFPATMPELAKAQQQDKFLLLGLLSNRKGKNKHPKGTHSFPKGMQELTEALHQHMFDEIKLHADGMKFIGSNQDLILSLPAYAAAGFFQGHELAELLGRVTYIPLISVRIFIRKEKIGKIPEGFGCVITPSEGFKTIGILFDHDIFPEHMHDDHFYSFKMMMRDRYDNNFKELVHLPQSTLEQLALLELDQLFGVKGEPELVVAEKYPKAIPLYSPEHYENLFIIDELLKRDFPNIRLFGNYTGQVSVRGMAQEAGKILNIPNLQ